MDRGGGQQGGDGSPLATGTTIGQDQQGRPFGNGFRGLPAKGFQRCFQSSAALVRGIQQGEFSRFQIGLGFQPGHILVR